jgi:hypothetical protein
MSLNIISILFLVVNAGLLFWLPRRWAPMPLLIGACYMTLGQGIEVGPFHFPIIRILIAAGLGRVIIRGERMAGGMNSMDWLMLFWSAWALVSSFFHNDPASAFVSRLGLIFNTCGVYFLLRIFCQSIEDIKILVLITAVLLMPVAVEMLFEKATDHNVFSVFGGVSELSEIRDGRIRAQGPFAHSILAGTVGAVCLPLMVCLWQEHRKLAFAGIVACLSMIFASGSSGPIISAIAAIGALFMWRYRHQMRFVQWVAVLGYIALDIVMKAPAYYLLARIDLVGGSTGWHRAALIESAFTHLKEWWLAGTDYTLHWMPTGVPWSPDHTDITNHYLLLGVLGGLPLMFLFIAILAKGFSFVGQTLRQSSDFTAESKFMLWALGAALFVHAVTCISVSYFDQSFVFLYLTLACIGSAYSNSIIAQLDVEFPVDGSSTS